MTSPMEIAGSNRRRRNEDRNLGEKKINSVFVSFLLCGSGKKKWTADKMWLPPPQNKEQEALFIEKNLRKPWAGSGPISSV
ncbi:unnamed protein product [Linum tenue]|uniref:Uncharacterized protein n=1 Tax=Linum tenue TaxID=586396 RepID=A0AAV0I2K6_9ROSI|nr:unnamed protein product [Linum tenue]